MALRISLISTLIAQLDRHVRINSIFSGSSDLQQIESGCCISRLATDDSYKLSDNFSVPVSLILGTTAGRCVFSLAENFPMIKRCIDTHFLDEMVEQLEEIFGLKLPERLSL